MAEIYDVNFPNSFNPKNNSEKLETKFHKATLANLLYRAPPGGTRD